MTLDNRVQIKVPASSANLGPGFDSIGIAVDLYLTLEVEQSNHWEFIAETEELSQFPNNEENFMCQVALKVASKYGKTLTPCKVKINSEIPLARGLGSSASAIVAAIELADFVGNLGLDTREKLLLATEMEGHPDNVGASLYGGLVVGCYHHNEVDLVSFPNLAFEMIAVIPNEELLTKDSRGVLPEVLPYSEAIQASATANVLVGALLSQNWELAGKMMESDLFHQPYRKQLIPFYSEIEVAAKENGAFGVALSGAGPTMLCFAEKGKGRKVAESLQQTFSAMSVKLLNIDDTGSNVYNLECAK
ncbi:homoserine kinase [Bacillus salipaludis]|uniref:Homoserine kinase n=1 Tax=Bacillus salipaludis TaxID=2547811 RepID=A0AA90RA04_9BACI|nr:homoserine kinase [Bacillus salipaludis]MDQ6600063.1 homoserine kinase [Bacillus salipaludis]